LSRIHFNCKASSKCPADRRPHLLSEWTSMGFLYSSPSQLWAFVTLGSLSHPKKKTRPTKPLSRCHSLGLQGTESYHAEVMPELSSRSDPKTQLLEGLLPSAESHFPTACSLNVGGVELGKDPKDSSCTPK
jgi:hypothetical protein